MAKRPRFMSMPAEPTAPAPVVPRRDMLEQHITGNNRQEVGFMHPVAAFMQAKTRMLERHDQARKREQLAGTAQSKMEVSTPQDWADESRDHQIMRHYKHHFTDMRGCNTVKRENITVKK